MPPIGVPSPLQLGDGTVAAPTFAFASEVGLGLYRRAAGFLDIASGGASLLTVGNTRLSVQSTAIIGWSASSPNLTDQDTSLARDGAGILALVNGANAQTFRVYGTTTGPKYLSLAHDSTHSIITSQSGDLKLGAAGNLLNWDGTEFYSPDTNTRDLGTATFKWRSAYLGTCLCIGTNPAAAGAIRLANNTYVAARNAANSLNVTLIGANASDRVVLGYDGTTQWDLQIGGAACSLGFLGATPVARPTYGAPTGTPTRTTFATGTVTLIQLAERVKAMIDDIRLYGLFA